MKITKREQKKIDRYSFLANQKLKQIHWNKRILLKTLYYKGHSMSEIARKSGIFKTAVSQILKRSEGLTTYEMGLIRDRLDKLVK